MASSISQLINKINTNFRTNVYRIPAMVARAIISRTNLLYDHRIPYPLSDGQSFLLPSGAKVCRNGKRNSYFIHCYSMYDMRELARMLE